MTSFAKVLLFGHQFDNRTGLGITLANLFANWPKDRIAVFANGIDVQQCELSRPCCEYIGQTTRKTLSAAAYNNKLRNMAKAIYIKSGLQDLRHKWNYKEEHVRRAIAFDPDILFCCLGSYGSMLDCEKMLERLPHAKLVLYIVDDWVNKKSRNDRLFKRLLDKSAGLLSICPYMSESYLKQYGKTFYPFHNPVDVAHWQGLHPEKKYGEDTTSIIYTGKINADTKGCLLDMCKAVQKLNAAGGKFVFDVYTPNYAYNAELLKDYESCHILPPIPHDEVASVMKSYSALFLTLGFSKASRTYVRLSMPTKLSEYLAAGVPTLLYCPREIALARYLESQDCAICCFEKGTDELVAHMQKLNDEKFCEQLVTKASQVALKHDVKTVRAEFEQRMNGFNE